MGANLFGALLGASLLASTSCRVLLPFDYYVLTKGPIQIDSEWTEIYCPHAIETWMRYEELWLGLEPWKPPHLDVPDYRERVAVLGDGKRVEIYAEVVDSEGRVYACLAGASGPG